MVKRIPNLFLFILLGILSITFILPSALVMAASKKKSAVTHKKKYKKHHRSRVAHKPCNTDVGKKQAIEFLRSSEELAGLADLQYDPQLHSTVLQQSLLDGETLTDEDLPSSSEEEAEEIETADDISVDINKFQQLWLSYMDETEGDGGYTSGGIEKKSLMNNILDWVGTRYYFGGTSRAGIDCSAFTQRVFYNAANIVLPRTASEQNTLGQSVMDISTLQFGDLVFFNTRKRVYVSHVGVYLGDGLFAHASSRYGVTVSSLNSTFYREHFIGGKRLLMQHISELAPKQEQSSLDMVPQ